MKPLKNKLSALTPSVPQWFSPRHCANCARTFLA